MKVLVFSSVTKKCVTNVSVKVSIYLRAIYITVFYYTYTDQSR